ncbi:MAG: hypothetical protein E7440_03900 [Ruminococcaceae bacterium]|nr:hypothetical protein [Oscillospiraceae bacterium]
MSLLEPKSLCSDVYLPDVKEDFRTADRVAQYRVSQKAFYLPAFPGWGYVPLSELTGVVVRNASLPTIGCCGKELPVLKLILRWSEGEKEFVIDPPKHADTILEHIRATRLDLEVDDRRE